eukprot:10661612-Alexandrium_andersonii.AAC.1
MARARARAGSRLAGNARHVHGVRPAGRAARACVRAVRMAEKARRSPWGDARAQGPVSRAALGVRTACALRA